jgi:1,4-dihydroxy-6-naphthoate synthase
MEVIQALSARARTDDAPVIAQISARTFLDLENRFEAVLDGSRASDQRGPRLVATEPMGVDDIKGKRVALPGTDTTEALLAETFLPAFTPVLLPAPDAVKALRDGEVAAAVIDEPFVWGHEGSGLVCIEDIGTRFLKYHAGATLPTRIWVIRRDVDPSVRASVKESLRASIEHAEAHREDALTKAMAYTEDAPKGAVDRFISAYLYKPDNGVADTAFGAGLDALREYADADYYAANGRF